MFQSQAVAAETNKTLLHVAALLNDSVRVVRDSASDEELAAYRLRVGAVMSEILEMLNLLYAAHPQIKPDGLS